MLSLPAGDRRLNDARHSERLVVRGVRWTTEHLPRYASKYHLEIKMHRLQRVICSVIATAGLLCWGSVLSAQGLPVGFEYMLDGEDLTMRVIADDVVDDLHVSLAARPGRTETFSRSSLGADEVWSIPVSAPTATTHYVLEISGDYAGQSGELSYEFDVEIAQDMDFEVDTSSFNASTQEFVMTMNQAAGHAELVVRGDDGSVIADRVIPFNGEPAGTRLTVRWVQPPDATILTIDVKAVGASGAWSARQYVPWQVQMDAVYVNFASGSSEVPQSDAAMLTTRLQELLQTADRVSEWVDVELYVAGYTDTVGAPGDNQRLSESRAQSLAQFLRAGGWSYPVHFQGFGEDVPAVPTGDSVDEPANRRALFILGTSQRPVTDQIPRANWRRL
jgi:outer membrane protein OmpA-like peptidoglycan-associated protein